MEFFERNAAGLIAERHGSDRLRIRRTFLPSWRVVASLLVVLSTGALRSEVLIERMFMPLDASPSSFAIGLPGGVNFCFDPVRGGVSYAWKGGFVDLTPVRPGPGKFINAA